MVIVEVLDGRVRRRFGGRGAPVDLPVPAVGDDVNEDFGSVFAGWTGRYRRAAAAGTEPGLRVLGAEIFAWLDQGGGLRDWLAGPERALEVREAPGSADAVAEAVLALVRQFMEWPILLFR